MKVKRKIHKNEVEYQVDFDNGLQFIFKALTSEGTYQTFFRFRYFSQNFFTDNNYFTKADSENLNCITVIHQSKQGGKIEIKLNSESDIIHFSNWIARIYNVQEHIKKTEYVLNIKAAN